MKNIKKVVSLIIVTISIVMFNVFTFATSVEAPTLTEVRQVSNDGLNLVFGGAGGVCVIIAIFQLVQGLMSLSESKRMGGFGQAKSDMISHFMAAAGCFIAAVLCFWGLSKALDLFHM